jgi:hypothetical protein
VLPLTAEADGMRGALMRSADADNTQGSGDEAELKAIGT